MPQQLTRCGLLLLLLFVSCLQLPAQQRTVTGIVQNQETREPLAGVTVGVKGTDRTTLTNEKGEFSIVVSGNESVVKFTYIGMAYQEIIVGEKTALTISLTKDNKQMEDVVVVGYGSTKKDTPNGGGCYCGYETDTGPSGRKLIGCFKGANAWRVGKWWL